MVTPTWHHARWKDRLLGHHQRQICRALIVGGGQPVATGTLLAWCFPRAGGKYRHSQRWSMYRAAKGFAVRIGRGWWAPNEELRRRIGADCVPSTACAAPWSESSRP